MSQEMNPKTANAMYLIHHDRLERSFIRKKLTIIPLCI